MSDFREISPVGLSHKKGIQLYSFLNYLKKADEYEELNIDYFYQKLTLLNQLNKIRLKDIIDVLNIEANYDKENGLITVYDNTFQSLIDELDAVANSESKFSNYKYKLVNEVFIKAVI
ncbi:hypothetical protein GC093_21325 [Paenibacillus sp. LMG 31456]|uniref:Uncharacterized protein n=1 Tax=Paenibacillus foliorum TaxID=2654974 RepID=A0A972GZH4_9BACL|nr:hypothetical protein [Paenibacillus foliorum]NOU95745.1 hypothetical protein [Paenibacillus foliorum]